MTHELLFAGFGGQGVMFTGRLAAYTGLVQDKNVSWMPSYGPEMRGGTSNCHIIISDDDVCSPIVVNPTQLVVMTIPAFIKFEKTVAPGGLMIVDTSLVDRRSERTDITQYLIPATQMADDMGLLGLSNMIMFGYLLKITGLADLKIAKIAIEKSVSSTKSDLVESNFKAVEAGYNYSA